MKVNICMFKSVNIKASYFILVFFMYILGMEFYLHDYYASISIVCYILIWLGLFVNSTLVYIPKGMVWNLVLLFSLSSFIFSLFYVDVVGTIRSLLILLTFLLCFNLVKRNINLFKYFLIASSIFAVMSYLLYLGNGEFLLWGYVASRNGSVFFDPNYAAIIFSISMIFSILFIENFFWKVTSCLLFLIPLFLTYSKGGWLAFLLGFFCYLYTKYSYRALIFIPICVLIGLYIFSLNVINLEMFRFEQGFNGRDIYINMALDYVFGDLNIFGSGGDKISELIALTGGGNSSTHNYYLDLLISVGVVPFFFLIPLLSYVFMKGCINKNVYLPVFVILFVSSFAVSVSVGGMGILSFLYTYALCQIIYENRES